MCFDEDSGDVQYINGQSDHSLPKTSSTIDSKLDDELDMLLEGTHHETTPSLLPVITQPSPVINPSPLVSNNTDELDSILDELLD